MRADTILITGASSGIGRALALQLAGPGRKIILWGRDAARLQTAANACEAKGAETEIERLDFMDVEAMIVRLAALDARLPLDLAIFNAGIGGSVPPEHAAEDPVRARAMAEVNFTAPVTGASLIAGHMAERGSGHIVLVGSVAGAYPLPMAPAYAGAKAGLAQFADALSLRMKKYGVAVTLVLPGFVDTPMSQGLKEPRPFLISADRAAAIIARKIAQGASRVVLPWQFALIMTVSKILPRPVIGAVLRAFMR